MTSNETDNLQPQIKLHNTYIPSPFPLSPSFYFQLTHLKSTLFIWVGTGKPSSDPVPSGSNAVLAPFGSRMGTEGGTSATMRSGRLGEEDFDAAEVGAESAIENGPEERKLAAEWAVAMPSRGVGFLVPSL